jgi:hypothetical protein
MNGTCFRIIITLADPFRLNSRVIVTTKVTESLDLIPSLFTL